MQHQTVRNQAGHLVLRPSPMQFCIKWLHLMFIGVLAFIVWATSTTGFVSISCIIIFLGMAVFLVCQAVNVARIRYILTGEQLIYQHGVLCRLTDYMELYRVIDYQETRTLMQQLFGLKNVILYSMDRNMPTLTLIGIHHDADIIHVIRERVEDCRRRKSIHEFTNGGFPAF